MTIDIWDTRQPARPGYEQDWNALLARCGSPNFSFDVRFLTWEARHGRHALAVRVEDGDRFGAIVIRAERGALVCGWPWRWQVVAGGAEPRPAVSRQWRRGPRGLPGHSSACLAS